MTQTSFPDRALMASHVAAMLLEIKAVHFRPNPPYILTLRSGEPGLYRLPQADLLPAHPLGLHGFRLLGADARRRR